MKDRETAVREIADRLGSFGVRVFSELAELAPLSATVFDDWLSAFSAHRPDGLQVGVGPKRIGRPLISNWREALGLPRRPRHQSNGHIFYVSHITLIYRGGRTGCGVLFLVYEYRTNTLFHYAAEVPSSPVPDPGLAWYVLHKACKKLKARLAPANQVPDDKELETQLNSAEQTLVVFPTMSLTPEDGSIGCEFKRYYDEVEKLHSGAAASASRTLTVTWLRHHHVTFVAGAWRVERQVHERVVPLELTECQDVNDLRRALKKLSIAISKSIRKSWPKTAKRGKPRWIALNEARSEPRAIASE